MDFKLISSIYEGDENERIFNSRNVFSHVITIQLKKDNTSTEKVTNEMRLLMFPLDEPDRIFYTLDAIAEDILSGRAMDTKETSEHLLKFIKFCSEKAIEIYRNESIGKVRAVNKIYLDSDKKLFGYLKKQFPLLYNLEFNKNGSYSFQ